MTNTNTNHQHTTTLADQLHKSATHKPGHDPSCPVCLKEEQKTNQAHQRYSAACEALQDVDRAAEVLRDKVTVARFTLDKLTQQSEAAETALNYADEEQERASDAYSERLAEESYQ